LTKLWVTGDVVHPSIHLRVGLIWSQTLEGFNFVHNSGVGFHLIRDSHEFAELWYEEIPGVFVGLTSFFVDPATIFFF